MHSNWKVAVRAGRVIPIAPLALLGILQAAASPGGASPAQPGQVPSCRGAQAEQKPETGAPEELPCLPVREGWVCREWGDFSKQQGAAHAKR